MSSYAAKGCSFRRRLHHRRHKERKPPPPSHLGLGKLSHAAPRYIVAGFVKPSPNVKWRNELRLINRCFFSLKRCFRKQKRSLPAPILSLSLLFLGGEINFIFLEQHSVHSKTEQKARKFPIGPLPPHMHSRPIINTHHQPYLFFFNPLHFFFWIFLSLKIPSLSTKASPFISHLMFFWL